MRRYVIFVLLLFLGLDMQAQRGGVAPLDRGDLQINFGNGLDGSGIPVYFSLDIALHKDVTLTPEIHARFPYYDHPFSGGMMVKADYHWNYLIGIPRNWDFYSGARAGFNFGDEFFPDLGIQVGGRWYWHEVWGLNVEFAGGTGFGATIGFSARLM